MSNEKIITIEHLSPAELESRGVLLWDIWEKEVSEFDYSYDEQEQCYFLTGEVTVTPKGGEPVTITKGDFVTFPKGLQCVWKVTAPVRKHYRFG